MTVEENIRVSDDLSAAFNARDWDRFAELYAESVVLYTPTSPEPVKGRATVVRQVQEDWANPFPDARIENPRTFGQGDWVCLTFTGTGTNKGPLKGPGGETIPATNKTVRVPFCIVSKVEGGKITESHQHLDVLGMMAQLGLAPE